MTPVSPIQRFLGLPEGADGPFELLGLRPDTCDDQSVRIALDRRLERVSRHPEGRGHEAEEVRLALHTAAAQLADPAVRSALAAQWEAARAGRTAEPRAWQDPTVAAFREAALPLFIGRGGLNARARRRLIALAHAHGLDVNGVRRALRPRPAPPAREGFPAPERVAHPTIYQDLRNIADAEGRRMARRVRSVMVMFVVVVIAIGLVIALATLAPRREPRDGTAAAGAPHGAVVPAPPDPAAGASARRERERRSSLANLTRPEPGEALERLRAATALLEKDPGEAAWRFDETARRLALWWTTFDAPSLGACAEAIAEFIHRAPAGAESSVRAIAAIGAGAEALADAHRSLGGEQVVQAVWSVGVLTRLARAGEAHGQAAEEIATRLGAALPGGAPPGEATFRNGAEAALRALVDRLPLRDPAERPLEAWRAWRDAIVSVEGRDDNALLTALSLLAAERVLTNDPRPSADPTSRDVLYFLLAGLEWRPPAGATAPTPAQARALAWFDNTAVRSDELGVVTEWLFSSSKAPGIDSGMILPRAADAAQRSTLRDRYVAAWSAGAQPERAGRRAELAAAWTAAATHEVARANDPPLLVASLARAATLARLSEAAALRWRGDLDGASSVLTALTRPVDDALRDASRNARATDPAALMTGPPPAGDGAWAAQYLSAAQNQAARIQAVTALEAREGPLGPVDADVLAEAALLDPASEARDRASHIVRTRAGEAVVVNGLLEALPGAPRRPATSALISDVTNQALPTPTSPAWPVAARRALVDTLIAQLALSGGGEALDLLAGVIADAYGGQSDRPPPATTSSAVGAPADPAGAAETIWRQRRAEAERSTLAGSPDALAKLDRRLTGRLDLAAGPVQRFAAVQTTLSELLARIVAAERPALADAVGRVMAEARERRRTASNIGAQLAATERSITQLWALRLGDALTPGTEGAP